jgi:sporulation protein YlmC with PRC-barrel domain
MESKDKQKMKQLLFGTGALIALTFLVGASSNVGEQPEVCLVDDLIGMKVVSQQGESLGKIEDIVVHPGGMPSHAVLSFGGWLGMGDKLFAMPWSVLRNVAPDTSKEGSERSLVLQVDKEKLKAAPGFDKKNWPSMASLDWAKESDAYYETDLKPQTKAVPAAAPTSVITWRVSQLKGTDVETPKGEDLGEIDAVAIDANGRVSFVALKIDASLFGKDTLVAVPWDTLKFSLGGDKGEEKRITLASTQEQLEQAPQFKSGKEHRAQMCDPEWITRVYAYYSCPTYWNPTMVGSSK